MSVTLTACAAQQTMTPEIAALPIGEQLTAKPVCQQVGEVSYIAMYQRHTGVAKPDVTREIGALTDPLATNVRHVALYAVEVAFQENAVDTEPAARLTAREFLKAMKETCLLTRDNSPAPPVCIKAADLGGQILNARYDGMAEADLRQLATEATRDQSKIVQRIADTAVSRALKKDLPEDPRARYRGLWAFQEGIETLCRQEI